MYQPVGLLGTDNEEEIFQNFLGSFRGLENIYLSLAHPMFPKALWETVARHKATLRRFIYHARSVNVDHESEFFEEELDLNDMGFLSNSFLQRDC